MCKSRLFGIDRVGTLGLKVTSLLRRPLLWSPLLLLAGIAIGVVVMGSADAMHGGRHAIGKRIGILNPLKFDNTELLLVLAVNRVGEIQPYYYERTGKPGEYEDIPNPIATKELLITVGNPKICWKTLGGDQECVVY